MGNINALATHKLKSKLTMMAVATVGALLMTVGFAAPSFAHGGYGHDRYDVRYDKHRDHDKNRCGSYGWYSSWSGRCVYHNSHKHNNHKRSNYNNYHNYSNYKNVSYYNSFNKYNSYNYSYSYSYVNNSYNRYW